MARFLVFHDILPETINNLESNLRFLKDQTNVISMEDFFSGRSRDNIINVVLTFDDGYKGWVTNGLPLLKRLNLPAAFFISSGFVDLCNQDEQAYAMNNLFVNLPPRAITGALTSDDVRQLSSAGHTIGGHTLNHSLLDKIRDVETLRYEIAEDKCRLERITGVKADFFSYPSGNHVNLEINLCDELKTIGYKGAVTLKPGFNSSLTNRYLLHRDIVNAGMPLSIFKARVFGNIDAVRSLKRWCGISI